jgi:hypothetical protein
MWCRDLHLLLHLLLIPPPLLLVVLAVVLLLLLFIRYVCVRVRKSVCLYHTMASQH